MPLLHSGTQRNHKDFSSDVPSNAVLVWHQMQNFFGRLWLWLCLGGAQALRRRMRNWPRAWHTGRTPRLLPNLTYIKRGHESTKTRNRKSPRFSVANVPVASQTVVGTLFSSKNCKKNRDRLRLFVARKKSQSSLGGGGDKALLGSKRSLRFSRTS